MASSSKQSDLQSPSTGSGRTDIPASSYDDPQPWSRLRQDAGALVWSSFLAACVATMFFFAYFDPLLLADDFHPPKWLSDRMTGYAVGFFFFWIVCAIAALLTAWLVDTRTDENVR